MSTATSPDTTTQKEQRVLISAGEGRSGGQLYRAALDAHRMLWEIDRLRMTIIVGPSLPVDEWQDLQQASQSLSELTLRRTVSDFGAELTNVRCAVCHCDYETAVDVIASGVAALFVPTGNGDMAEHNERAQRLTRWGISRILPLRNLNGASMANAIHQLIRFKPAQNDFHLDGAEASANLIHELWLETDLEQPDFNTDREQ